jgi:ATP-dependent Clp protease ATP-binding subunit ClpC
VPDFSGTLENHPNPTTFEFAHPSRENRTVTKKEAPTNEPKPVGDFGKLLAKDDSPPLVQRDSVLEMLLRFLRSSKPSVLLIGPSGCGKTALIQTAAAKIDRGIVESTTTQMLVGTRWLGEFETRLQSFVNLCIKDRHIIYFTDIWSLYRTGRSSSSDKSVGSFLAPYLARGEVSLIGECTEEQYRAAVEDDRTFGSQFQVIHIPEATDAESAEMLAAVVQQRKAKFLNNHLLEILIDESVKRRILEESKMAFPSVAAPGRVIRLLDALISEEVEPALLSNQPPEQITVRPQTVIKVVEKLTGMSLQLLDEGQPLRAEQVRQWLETRVLGQPEAIKAVVDLVMMIKSGLTRSERPVAVMMFVGPTGVGKTELAKRLAEYVFGSDSRLIRFDMGEFQDGGAVQRLAGNPWSSDPTSREGLLTGKVRNQPFSVVLLDEIEKASFAVHQLLLGVFGSGRLTDPQGRTTDFTRSIFIMTSNLGSDLSAHRDFGLKPSEFSLKEKVAESMTSFFSPEFRGRITRHVLFQPLQLPELRILAQREIGKILLERGIRRRNVQLDIDASVYDYVLGSVSTDPLGARILAARVEEMVVLPLSYRLAELTPRESGNIVRMSVKKGAVVVSVVKPAEEPAADSADSEAKVRSVRITAAAPGKTVKLTRRALDRLLADLQGQTDYLLDLCQQFQMDKRKGELIGATIAEGFWDDPVAAKQVLTEIHRIDSSQAMVNGIGAEMNQLQYMNRDTSLPAGAMEAIGRRAMKLQARVGLARYALHFQDASSRCPAFVEIRLMGVETLKDNPAGRIAGVYAAWAKNHHLPVTVLHEEIKDDLCLHAILLIEGVAMTGILAGEQGLHELHRPGKGRQRAASAFVEVNILPRLEESPRLPTHQLAAKKAVGKGKLAHAFRSEIQIDCDELGLKLCLRGELAPPEAKGLAGELIASLLHRRGQRPARNGDEIEERPIRRYTLGPGGNVKDYQTGFSHGGLEGIWQGQIDDLIYASLGRRIPTTDDRPEAASGAQSAAPASSPDVLMN